jgi:hypothetical protein
VIILFFPVFRVWRIEYKVVVFPEPVGQEIIINPVVFVRYFFAIAYSLSVNQIS